MIVGREVETTVFSSAASKLVMQSATIMPQKAKERDFVSGSPGAGGETAGIGASSFVPIVDVVVAEHQLLGASQKRQTV
jgi:hypothetical protein